MRPGVSPAYKAIPRDSVKCSCYFTSVERIGNNPKPGGNICLATSPYLIRIKKGSLVHHVVILEATLAKHELETSKGPASSIA